MVPDAVVVNRDDGCDLAEQIEDEAADKGAPLPAVVDGGRSDLSQAAPQDCRRSGDAPARPSRSAPGEGGPIP